MGAIIRYIRISLEYRGLCAAMHSQNSCLIVITQKAEQRLKLVEVGERAEKLQDKAKQISSSLGESR